MEKVTPSPKIKQRKGFAHFEKVINLIKDQVKGDCIPILLRELKEEFQSYEMELHWVGREKEEMGTKLKMLRENIANPGGGGTPEGVVGSGGDETDGAGSSPVKSLVGGDDKVKGKVQEVKITTAATQKIDMKNGGDNGGGGGKLKLPPNRFLVSVGEGKPRRVETRSTPAPKVVPPSSGGTGTLSRICTRSSAKRKLEVEPGPHLKLPEEGPTPNKKRKVQKEKPDPNPTTPKQPIITDNATDTNAVAKELQNPGKGPQIAQKKDLHDQEKGQGQDLILSPPQPQPSLPVSVPISTLSPRGERLKARAGKATGSTVIGRIGNSLVVSVKVKGPVQDEGVNPQDNQPIQEDIPSPPVVAEVKDSLEEAIIPPVDVEYEVMPPVIIPLEGELPVELAQEEPYWKRQGCLESISNNPFPEGISPSRFLRLLLEHIEYYESVANCAQLLDCMKILECLFQNPSVNLKAKATRIYNALRTCVTSPKLHTTPDCLEQWALRDLGASLLGKLIQLSPRFRQQVTSSIQANLGVNTGDPSTDPIFKVPLATIYGTVLLAKEMGEDVITSTLIASNNNIKYIGSRVQPIREDGKGKVKIKSAVTDKDAARRIYDLILELVIPILMSMRDYSNISRRDIPALVQEFGYFGGELYFRMESLKKAEEEPREM